MNRCFEYFISEIYFVLKKCKEIENSSANYQTEEIICSTDYKTFQRSFTVYFAFKSVKEIENSSADYQTKEIICSTGCKNI